MYKFEFDTNKSCSNSDKHGTNFTDAQELWAAPDYIQVKVKSDDEQRYSVLGVITGKNVLMNI
jgi:uncharacterized DUF497 family protein